MEHIYERFHSRNLSPASTKKAGEIRRRINGLADKINTMVPDCREKSVAMTKLEEASMWAVKAVAATQPKE